METTIENKIIIEFENILEIRDFAAILLTAIEADRISRLPESKNHLFLNGSQKEMIEEMGKKLNLIVGNML